MDMASTNHVAGRTQRNGAAKHTVMIVDDHPLVCKGLEELIREEPDLKVAAVVGTAAEAMTALGRECPDLMLLDLSLPGVGGLDLLKNVRAQYPGVQILVLSMHEESVFAERSLRAGAQGYIMKQEPGEKVIEAIRCVLSGNIYASPEQLTRLLRKVAANGEVERGACGPEALADRELQVFTLIGEGCAAREIAKRLNLSPKTVQTYREHIKSKLGLASATELTRYAVLWHKGGC